MKLINLLEEESTEVDLSKMKSYDEKIEIKKGQSVIGMGKFIVSPNNGIMIDGGVIYLISVNNAITKMQHIIMAVQFGKLDIDDAMDQIDDILTAQEERYSKQYPDGEFWSTVGYSKCLDIAKARIRKHANNPLGELKVFENNEFDSYIMTWGVLTPENKTQSPLAHLFPNGDMYVLDTLRNGRVNNLWAGGTSGVVNVLVRKQTSTVYIIFRLDAHRNRFKVLELDVVAGRMYNAITIIDEDSDKICSYVYADKTLYPAILPYLHKLHVEVQPL